MYRSYLNISQFSLPSFPLFECIAATIKSRAAPLTIVTIYRPPSLSLSIFLNDFAKLLEILTPLHSNLIISGDFNIHMDDNSDHYASAFNTLLQTFDLSQHVKFQTHTHGHTLDLLITRSDSTLISSVDWIIPFLSDHFAILSTLSVPLATRPAFITKTFRSINKIDLSKFRSDLIVSDIFSDPKTTLSTLTTQILTTLSTLLDKHAPIRTISCPDRPTKPFITLAICSAKKLRSKLKTKYRRSKSLSDFQAFKSQSRILSSLLTAEKNSFYRNKISENKHCNC